MEQVHCIMEPLFKKCTRTIYMYMHMHELVKHATAPFMYFLHNSNILLDSHIIYLLSTAYMYAHITGPSAQTPWVSIELVYT